MFDPTRPRLVGDGPATCSTCIDMIPYAVWPHDANAYYADLNVPRWARKREMVEAYKARKGQRSPRLTFILRQFLDPAVKERYDRTPFGALFWDEYVDERIRRKKADLHAKLAAAKGVSPFDLPEEESEVVESVPSFLDSEEGNLEDAHQARWGFSYYLWGTEEQDESKLARWQELLVRAFAERRETRQIGVGLQGRTDEPWTVEKIGSRTVVFLRHDMEPNVALAREAASSFVEVRTRGYGIEEMKTCLT